MVLNIVRGLITADLKRHFSFAIQAHNTAVRTRGHTFKLKTTRYRLNIAHNLFFNRVVSTWNGLPQHIVHLESSLSFKKALRTVNFHSLKLKCSQYPAIHTNYSCSNCTISN